MIVNILTILTIVGLSLGWFGIIETSLTLFLIVIAPYALSFVIAGLMILYVRMSQERWEEFQQAMQTELAGQKEFAAVMVGVIIEGIKAFFTRKKENEDTTAIDEESVSPPEATIPPVGGIAPSPPQTDTSESLTR